MIFRIAVVEALLLACLICGLFPAAKAQSSAGAQHILFSAPNGQITSNAPLPMAQAPEPRETPNLPAGQAAIHEFSAPTPAPMFLPPPLVLQQDSSKDRGDSRDPMNIRKQMGVLTPAQIMNVPTPEQIFGLAEKGAGLQGKTEQRNIGQTNFLALATNGLAVGPAWANVWSQDTGKSNGTSNDTERASGFFTGFFDTARNDNRLGNHDANNSDAFFGSPQPAGQQSSQDSALAGSLFFTRTPPASAPGSGLSTFAAPGTSSGLGSSSRSPFTPPQVSSMDTIPRLPTLPTVPGQNDTLAKPATTPSWAPKPPPWTTPQTPLGTPIR